MAYVMKHPVSDRDTPGQCWHDETVRSAVFLCSHRTTNNDIYRACLGGDVLEAGCGIGNWVFHLQNRGIDIIGIDTSGEAIATARRHDPNVPILRADVRLTGFEDGHFSTVLSFGVVEHFQVGPYDALRETHRILEDRGVLVITVPTQNINRVLIANPLKNFKRWVMEKFGTQYDFEEYRYTRKEFEWWLDYAGFDIVATVPDEYHLPYNVGLWVDYPILGSNKEKWRLNWAGVLLKRTLDWFSPWLSNGMTMWICVKR